MEAIQFETSSEVDSTEGSDLEDGSTINLNTSNEVSSIYSEIDFLEATRERNVGRVIMMNVLNSSASSQAPSMSSDFNSSLDDTQDGGPNITASSSNFDIAFSDSEIDDISMDDEAVENITVYTDSEDEATDENIRINIDSEGDTTDEDLPAPRPLIPLGSQETCSENCSHGDCPICLNKYFHREPHVTPCGHIFCKSCAITSIQNMKKCPVCKYKIHPSQLKKIFM